MDSISACRICYTCSGGDARGLSQILIPIERTAHLKIGTADYVVRTDQLCLLPGNLTYQCESPGALLVIRMPKANRPDDRLRMVDTDEQTELLVQVLQKELRNHPNSTMVWHLYDYLCDKQEINAASCREWPEQRDLPAHRPPERTDTCGKRRRKKSAGTSTDIYLRNMRIARAKDMLRSTQCSMMEIAETVGYSGNATFTRAFRNAEGMTPTQYRLRLQRQSRHNESV